MNGSSYRAHHREAAGFIAGIDVHDVGDAVARHVVVVERLAELLCRENRDPVIVPFDALLMEATHASADTCMGCVARNPMRGTGTGPACPAQRAGPASRRSSRAAEPTAITSQGRFH